MGDRYSGYGRLDRAGGGSVQRWLLLAGGLFFNRMMASEAVRVKSTEV